jgi:hypothetical protein
MQPRLYPSPFVLISLHMSTSAGSSANSWRPGSSRASCRTRLSGLTASHTQFNGSGPFPSSSLFFFFAPESPWWLVRRGRIEDARTALIRLRSKSGHPGEIDETLAMIIHTNELEMQQSAGTSYIQCFRNPVDRRRTELTIMTWLIQQTSGSPMIGWGTYFMTQVGLTEANAYSLGVAQSAMGFVGTVGSWFLMPYFGRRTLYLWGQVVMFVGLMAIGNPSFPLYAFQC